MSPFQCSLCGQTVFFDNDSCTHCSTPLAYHPERRAMLALDDGAQACANRLSAACNWLVTDAPGLPCRSCRLTRVIPDLSVLTGHADGVITINIDEADDVAREQARVAMGEPVRSLLGHPRHEVSHCLQFRWLRTPQAMAACRDAFGDETQDYAAALARHHANGPPPDWAQHCISAYASAHPWEDWAETCAHVLLVADALETASRWGLQLQGPASSGTPSNPLPRAPGLVAGNGAAETIGAQAMRHWLPIAGFVNAMNRSLGLPDP